MNAAGTVKTKMDVWPLLRTPVTHVVVGSITVESRIGNPEPKFWVAPDGSYALNCLGLPNPGADYYKEHLPEIAERVRGADKKLVVSIAGINDGDWATLASLAAAHADMIEINLGCPNVWGETGRKPIVSYDLEAIQTTVSQVIRAAPHGTYSVKLSPLAAKMRKFSFEQVRYLLETLPIREIVSCNTIPDVSTVIDGEKRLSMPAAGKSGKALLPYSLEQCMILSHLMPDVSITGAGGISNGGTIALYVEAGATGVQIGTHFWIHGSKVFSELLQEYATIVPDKLH